MAYLGAIESGLDRFLPPNIEKCGIFDCTAGKVWAVLAALSVAINYGDWNRLVTAIAWQFFTGIGVLLLCRACQTGWIWALAGVATVPVFLKAYDIMVAQKMI